MEGLLGWTTPFIWTIPGLLLAALPELLPAGLPEDGLLLAALPLAAFLRDICSRDVIIKLSQTEEPISPLESAAYEDQPTLIIVMIIIIRKKVAAHKGRSWLFTCASSACSPLLKQPLLPAPAGFLLSGQQLQQSHVMRHKTPPQRQNQDFSHTRTDEAPHRLINNSST